MDLNKHPGVGINAFTVFYRNMVSEKVVPSMSALYWKVVQRKFCWHYLLINDKNCSLTIVLTAMDEKLQKS